MPILRKARDLIKWRGKKMTKEERNEIIAEAMDLLRDIADSVDTTLIADNLEQVLGILKPLPETKKLKNIRLWLRVSADNIATAGGDLEEAYDELNYL